MLLVINECEDKVGKGGCRMVERKYEKYETDTLMLFHVAIMMPFQIPSKSIGSHNAWQQS